FVPPLDYLSRSQEKAERDTAIDGAIELLAVAIGRRRAVEPTGVMDDHGFAGDLFGTRALFLVDGFELCHVGTEFAGCSGRNSRSIGSRLARRLAHGGDGEGEGGQARC